VKFHLLVISLITIHWYLLYLILLLELYQVMSSL